jgi:serine kinase of HPr protein (carbohydrate metabolism regulator)
MAKDGDLEDNALAEFLLGYSFGLAKSLINGLISFAEPDGVGCHGAVFELDGKGVALLGATGSGKSTHALHFLLSDESAILVTDDWSIVHYRDPDFVATALEKQFFARRTQIEELLKYHPQAIHADERVTLVDGGSRIDLDLRSVLGQNRFAKQIGIDVCVCITKTHNGETEVREMKESEFVASAISNSPHIPFHSTNTEHYEEIKARAGQDLYSTMENCVDSDTRFWRRVYERLPVYSVSYSESTPESTVQTLIQQVVEAA